MKKERLYAILIVFTYALYSLSIHVIKLVKNLNSSRYFVVVIMSFFIEHFKC